MKWKTKKERIDACENVCSHLEKGLSQKCFPDADWDTVERYMKDYPEDFPSERISVAKRQGRLLWEKMGIKGATGQYDKFNASSYIFNMKNRYGWRDNPIIEEESSIGSNVHIYIPDNGRNDPAHQPDFDPDDF